MWRGLVSQSVLCLCVVCPSFLPPLFLHPSKRKLGGLTMQLMSWSQTNKQKKKNTNKKRPLCLSLMLNCLRLRVCVCDVFVVLLVHAFFGQGVSILSPNKVSAEYTSLLHSHVPSSYLIVPGCLDPFSRASRAWRPP